MDGRSEVGRENDAVQQTSTARWEFAVYALAILAWAALGIWYKPILSMFLAPFVMPFLVAYVPRRLSRFQGRAR